MSRCIIGTSQTQIHTLRVVTAKKVVVAPRGGPGRLRFTPECDDPGAREFASVAPAALAADRLAYALSGKWSPYAAAERQLLADARDTLFLFGFDPLACVVQVVRLRRLTVATARGYETRTATRGPVVYAMPVAEVLALAGM